MFQEIYRPTSEVEVINGIEVIRLPTPEEVDRLAANIVVSQVLSNPDSILGLPTGSTPQGMYTHLVGAYREGEVSFAGVRVFNLDEYYSLEPDHPSSYRQYMLRHFVGHVDLDLENFHIPNSNHPNPEVACWEYEQLIRACGGLDLTVLGIGPGITCHIAFNERGTPFDSRTHLAKLDPDTIEANRQYFENPHEIPKQAITMGIATIMDSQRIILLAKGAHKAEGVALALKGEVTEEYPASILQTHSQVSFILDAAAALSI